tara:strand:- start:271 stop:441 length:171 start_codon:yes stop_codon:yes gene_type:complete
MSPAMANHQNKQKCGKDIFGLLLTYFSAKHFFQSISNFFYFFFFPFFAKHFSNLFI